MPFNLKKTFGPNDQCTDWVVIGAKVYSLVINKVSGYTRVYDENYLSISTSNNLKPARIFNVSNRLFLVSSNSSNVLIILYWNGTVFTTVGTFTGYSVITDLCIFNSEAYITVTGTGGSKGALFKFDGSVLGAGLTILKSSNTKSFQTVDVSQVDNSIYYGVKAPAANGGATEIHSLTTGGIDTLIFSLPATFTDIYKLRLFNNLVHFTRMGNAAGAARLSRLTTLLPGAAETIIASYVLTAASVYKLAVYNNELYLKIEGTTYKYNGSGLPVLYDTIAGFDRNYIGEYTVYPTELISGEFGKFMTTSFVCDLAFADPPFTKTDETGFATNDGTITVHATSSAYIQYALRFGVSYGPYQSSNVFTGLAAGVYHVKVKDSNGCEVVATLDAIIEENTPPPPPPPPPSGDLTINNYPLNSNNYFTWFSAEGDTGFTSEVITNCINTYGLPKPYRLNKPVAVKHWPWVLNDEQFSFYINFDLPFTYPNFSSLRLCLINRYGLIQSDIAPLFQVTNETNNGYYIYANVEFTSIPLGVYRMGIVDVSNSNSIMLVSNELKVVRQIDADAKSAMFRYKNSVNIFKFLYESVPGYINQVRLRCAEIEKTTEGTLEQYRSASSGKLRNVSVELDKSYKLEMYYFDDLAHAATDVLQIHDYIFINQKSYLAKSMYKPDWGNPGRTTNKGILDLYEQDFSMINRYGTKDAITIVGSEDDLLLGDDGFIKL